MATKAEHYYGMAQRLLDKWLEEDEHLELFSLKLCAVGKRVFRRGAAVMRRRDKGLYEAWMLRLDVRARKLDEVEFYSVASVGPLEARSKAIKRADTYAFRG
jgi:hypothetical protein